MEFYQTTFWRTTNFTKYILGLKKHTWGAPRQEATRPASQVTPGAPVEAQARCFFRLIAICSGREIFEKLEIKSQNFSKLKFTQVRIVRFE